MADVDPAGGDDQAPAGGCQIRRRHAGRIGESARRAHALSLPERVYTLYTLYSTIEPETIGTNLTSGCTGLLTQDMIDLYDRTPVKTKVIVLKA